MVEQPTTRVSGLLPFPQPGTHRDTPMGAAAGLLAAAAELCGGGAAWLVRRIPGGKPVMLARWGATGPDAAVMPAIVAALDHQAEPGGFQATGRADGPLSLAGAAAHGPSGDAIAILCHASPAWPLDSGAIDALGALARAAAVLADIPPPRPRPLQDSLLQTVIDAVPDHIWVKDTAGRYVAVNRAAAEAFGFAAPHLAIGRTVRDVYPPDRVALAEAEDRTVFTTGKPLFGTVHRGILSTADRWWFANKIPLKDASGRVIGLVGISRDITDLETARADRERDRDRLQQIIDAIPDPLFVKDRDGRIVLHNRPAADRLAHTLGDSILGARVADYYTGERLERALEEDRQVLETGQPVLNALHKSDADGGIRWTLVSKAPLFDPGGAVEGIVGISRDVTALHQAERALQADRDNLQVILDALPVSVYVKDADRRYVRINRAAADRMGLAHPDDAVGKTAAEVWDPETAARTTAEEERLLRSEEDEIEGIDFNPRPDGRDTVVIYLKRLLRDADGHITGFVGTERDITGIFTLQRDLAVARAAREEARRRAERLSTTKGGMLAMLTHEFRTPLTAINGYADMIRNYDLDTDSIRDFAAEISLASRRLAELTDEMLELDRLQSGTEDLALSPVALEPILTEVVDLLDGPAADHDIRLDLPPGLPPVRGNEGALRRIFTNIIGNAIKYSPDGGAVEIAAAQSGLGFIDIAIRDHGLGIPQEDLERIFEPYVRLAEGKRRGIGGTGLGLPIVRELARAQGGAVRAERPPDGGSLFRVSLPIDRSQPE